MRLPASKVLCIHTYCRFCRETLALAPGADAQLEAPTMSEKMKQEEHQIGANFCVVQGDNHQLSRTTASFVLTAQTVSSCCTPRRVGDRLATTFIAIYTPVTAHFADLCSKFKPCAFAA